MHQGPYSRSTTCFQRPRGATVARLTADQKVACSNHVGVRWSLIGVKCLIWTVSFYLAIRSPKKMETWMPKLKPIRFEPELNQRSKDSQHFIHSALLYQLIYRKMRKPQATTTDQKFRKPNLLRFLREIGLRFVVNASRALLKKHHLFSETSWCNSSTSDCRSEGCVIKSLRGQVISYWHEMSNMKNAFFVTG